MNNNIESKESNHAIDKKYYTQEEVAVLFRVSQSTIKNWRDKGLLEFLQPTGSTRVLYPRETIRLKHYTSKERLSGSKTGAVNGKPGVFQPN
jgi:hypothetical protein